MAKKKKSKTVYRTKTKTVRSYIGRAKARAGGAVAGFIAGAGGTLVSKYMPTLGQWTQPAADILTGSMMGNDTLTTIGGRSIGAMLASGIGGAVASNGGSGYSMVG